MKRACDIAVAVPLFVAALPVMFVLSIAIRLKLGSPVLFRQFRPGLGGRPFCMAKFRTMTNTLDSEGELLPDALRQTPFGRFLRSTSLDELPELWNVIRGDMSIVGPRPLLMEYMESYSSEQARRHVVRPGITGWAQVNGRNAISWEEKFQYDVWYVDNQSFTLDLKILYLTAKSVVRREHIDSDGGGTVAKFTGTEQVRPS